MERGLTVLETIAAASPLLGLLGTGFGMIEVFRVVAAQGAGQAQLLSGGISEALITTVTGLAIAISVSIFATTGVFAADGAELYKTKTCNACHGNDAKTTIMPNYPKLAGQNADYAYQQMLDIKTGVRNNGQTAAMKGVMHLVTDEELRAIADWLATQ